MMMYFTSTSMGDENTPNSTPHWWMEQVAEIRYRCNHVKRNCLEVRLTLDKQSRTLSRAITFACA